MWNRCHYPQVVIVKPMTSCPTSPERFLVCKGFAGCKSILTEVHVYIILYMHMLHVHVRVYVHVHVPTAIYMYNVYVHVHVHTAIYMHVPWPSPLYEFTCSDALPDL